jgi:hypothetical protein
LDGVELDVLGSYTIIIGHYVGFHLLEGIQMGIHISNILLKFYLDLFYACFEFS